MAVYSLFLKEVPVNEGTAEGGTAEEALGRETVEPTLPGTPPLVKMATTEKKKVEGKGFGTKKGEGITGALATELSEGKKIVAATLHVCAGSSAEGKKLKFGFIAAAVFAEPTTAATRAWKTVSLSTAQAEELTKTAIEALTVLGEKLTATNTLSFYEFYLTVETGTGGGTTTAACKTAVLVKDSLNATMIAQAQAQAKEQFATQVTSQQRITAGVVAEYSFRDGASVAVMNKVQALTRLEFIDAATPNAIMQARASAKVVMSDQASVQQVSQVAGNARLVFAGEAHAKATQEEGGGTRKVAVFIFED